MTFDAGASTACSIVSDQLHVLSGTGTCSITATKAGDLDYNPTTSAPFTVTINKANQAALDDHRPGQRHLRRSRPADHDHGWLGHGCRDL